MPILTKALSSVLGASWLHKPKLSGSRLALCLTAAHNGQHSLAKFKTDAKHVCASLPVTLRRTTLHKIALNSLYKASCNQACQPGQHSPLQLTTQSQWFLHPYKCLVCMTVGARQNELTSGHLVHVATYRQSFRL